MAKVYLVQMPKRKDRVTGQLSDFCDISPARIFGDIEPALFPSFGAGYFTQNDVHEVRRRLKDYCDEDSLLLIGDPAAMALSAVLAAEVNRGQYSVLRWDNMRHEYMRLTFNTRGN